MTKKDEIREIEVSTPQSIGFEFKGSASEYFRIWIVNLALTLVTFGIYAAWAKVRTRQYFYGNTLLADHAFEYRGNPKAILKGNLIIGGVSVLYMVVNRFSPTYTAGVLVLFYLILPFLVYKSLRFNAHNSAYRNIRFRFFGSLGDSYKTYLLFPLLLPFTLGLIYPSWTFRRKRYFFDNLAYGEKNNQFAGRSRPFYKYYMIVSLVLICVMIISGAAATFIFPFFKEIFSAAKPEMIGVLFLIPFIIYPVMVIVFTFVQQFLYAKLTNYCWNLSRLDGICFKSTLKARKLIWIRISNLLAIVFSVGLLIPWAKVRRTRYILENLSVLTETSIDGFASGEGEDVSALGDSATDFFGLEIGL